MTQYIHQQSRPRNWSEPKTPSFPSFREASTSVTGCALDQSSARSLEQSIVYFAETDAVARELLNALLYFSDWRTESFSSVAKLLEGTPHAGPSCLVIDLDLPSFDGLDLQRLVAIERKEMPVIFVTERVDVHVAVQAMKAGAADFFTKPFHRESLLQAINASLTHSRNVIGHAMEIRAIRACHETLSHREREVMTFVVRGKLNKQIAGELGISEITVKIHRGSAMRKMKAKSLADLVRMAIKLREEGDAMGAENALFEARTRLG